MSDFEEHVLRASIVRDEAAHQKMIGFRSYCNGCGWPSGYCCCPGSVEAAIRRLEESLPRIVFLDCDGVINYAAMGKKVERRGADPACVARVVRIAREGRAQIVLSSAWRGYEDWREHLEALGVPGDLLLDRTGRSRNRGAEISEWIETRAVGRYIVIDDEVFDLGEHRSRCIQTNFRGRGLQDQHVEAALTLLRGEVG